MITNKNSQPEEIDELEIIESIEKINQVEFKMNSFERKLDEFEKVINGFSSSTNNAVNIFKCGSLQALTKWRGVSSSVLKEENRNAANDPEDYFDYVMFAWGYSQAGDRLVMERKMKRLKQSFRTS